MAIDGNAVSGQSASEGKGEASQFPKASVLRSSAEHRAIQEANELFPEASAFYTEREKADFLLRLSSAVEGRVAFESGWISQRMTWLVIAQSFLFTALATALSFKTLISSRLQITIVVVALVQVLIAWISICAAKCVAHDLSALRGKVDAAIKSLALVRDEAGRTVEGLGYWTILGLKRYGLSAWTYSGGAVASHLICLSLLAAWGYLACLLLRWQ